jgi:hypothetical protein
MSNFGEPERETDARDIHMAYLRLGAHVKAMLCMHQPLTATDSALG